MKGIRRSAILALALVALPSASARADTVSPLYLTLYDSISVVQGGGVVNSWSTSSGYGEWPIAVDDTVRTWEYYADFYSTGHEYTLGGVPTGNTYPNNFFACCFYDGTTDGTANYAIQYASGDVYRFNSDWTSPTLLFSSGLDYGLGITYDPTDASLWLLQHYSGLGNTQVQHRTLSGALLGTFLTGQNYTTALALDHADNSLWLFDWNEFTGAGDLRQYSKVGAPLSSQSWNSGFVYGGEFALTSVPDHASTFILLLGSALMCAGLRWRSRRSLG